MKSIAAFGNPLLDVTITSKELIPKLLNKYNLKYIDGQTEIDREKMKGLTKDIEGYEYYVSPGGCSQNSLRVLQWMIRQGRHTIFGSVGRDQEADILRKVLKAQGVQTNYITQDDLPTGKTIALISGNKRFLVAHIGAANVLTLPSLVSHPNFLPIFNQSNIVLIEAYFLTNRFETAHYITDFCQKSSKTIAFNLCGTYIFQIVPDPIRHLVKCADLIFGNKEEFEALTKLLGTGSLKEMANKHGKTLVVTDGPRAVICYSSTKVMEMVPPTLPVEEIQDTTAAGDAFVGGFLAGYIMSKDLETCIKMGFYAASCIIKEIGCSLPKYEPRLDF